jgi:uncharacterized phage-associated protein
MANAHDVAAYILSRRNPITAMKLQKLVYYCQAWSLVWDEAPIFGEEIEAWANGPVVRDLYERHRGMFKVSSWETGNPNALTTSEKETVNLVLDFYGKMSSQQLSNLTHQEKPWRLARKGLSSDERGSHVISLGSMHEYYSSLTELPE